MGTDSFQLSAFYDTPHFTICLFISPDLDGHRAPKMKYCPRRDPQKVSQPEYEATALLETAKRPT